MKTNIRIKQCIHEDELHIPRNKDINILFIWPMTRVIYNKGNYEIKGQIRQMPIPVLYFKLYIKI